MPPRRVPLSHLSGSWRVAWGHREHRPLFGLWQPGHGGTAEGEVKLLAVAADLKAVKRPLDDQSYSPNRDPANA